MKCSKDVIYINKTLNCIQIWESDNIFKQDEAKNMLNKYKCVNTVDLHDDKS